MNKKRKMKTKFILALAVAAACLLAGGRYVLSEDAPLHLWPGMVPPESHKVDESKPLRAQTRTFELAGRTFVIPIMYIDGHPKPGVHQDDMLLKVIWPDMRAIYELNNRQEYLQVHRKERRIGWILLEPAAIRPSFDVQIASRRQYLAKEEPAGRFDGLEKYLWYNGSPKSPELRSEMYLESDESGHITGTIECHVGPAVVVPGCSHRFIDRDLLYQINYRMGPFFPQWREQKSRAIEFINRMELTTPR